MECVRVLVTIAARMTAVMVSSTVTPRAIVDHADVGEPFSFTAAGELLFKGGTVEYSRLLRIPLVN